ncbi:MAG: hypothetical protein JO107_03055 [Hyphomicrobiales bacterium]|nr:hypothetical protein [Hyphomicrobiales bacterium]
MTITPDEAGAMLRDVDAIVAKVKMSRVYRRTGEVTMLWGAIILLERLAGMAAPHWWSWLGEAGDVLGVAATLLLLLRGRSAKEAQIPLRLLGAFALFFAFGFLWCDIGRFGPRELSVFWPTLFLFGYALAGLWFGPVFIAFGVGLSALILAGYAFAGEGLDLWLALVNGGGFILIGLWMRRA